MFNRTFLFFYQILIVKSNQCNKLKRRKKNRFPLVILYYVINTFTKLINYFYKYFYKVENCFYLLFMKDDEFKKHISYDHEILNKRTKFSCKHFPKVFFKNMSSTCARINHSQRRSHKMKTIFCISVLHAVLTSNFVIYVGMT